MARLDAREELANYNEVKAARAYIEREWRAAALHCLPRQYADWQNDGPPNRESSMDRTSSRIAYDSTGMRSLPKYVSILERIATPTGRLYQKLKASNADLMRIHSVQVYFGEVNRTLFRERYASRARFVQANGETFQNIGVYGIGPKSITWRKPTPQSRRGGLSYKAWSVRDIFIMVDDENNVVAIYRRMFMNARQAAKKFGADNLPPKVKAEYEKPNRSETTSFEFVHVLKERDDYAPDALNARRHPICANYIAVEDAVYVGEEEGFASLPYVTPRVATEADNPYGFSPAMIAKAALGGSSQMKKTVIKQAHKAVDPPLLANDDGVLSGRVDIRPGAVNYGGVDNQGRRLVQPIIDNARFDVATELIQDDRGDIEDSFFVKLFTLLEERPEMTATQVVEEMGQKASLLAPTMGRLQAEYLGPMTEREILLLAEHGMLPPMPPEMIEAAGEYVIDYDTPLANALSAEEVKGFMQLAEFATGVAEKKQDPAPLDWLDFDRAIPDMGGILSVRPEWLRSEDAVKAIRADRAQSQETAQVLEQAPAIAGVVSTAMKQPDKRMQ